MHTMKFIFITFCVTSTWLKCLRGKKIVVFVVFPKNHEIRHVKCKSKAKIN